MRWGASLGQRGWHGYGLQLNADAHEDARALTAFDFFKSTVPTDRTGDLPAQCARHLFNRSFGVISGAPVTRADEDLRIGVNDGGRHNFESYRLWDSDRLTQADVDACFWICRGGEK